MWFFTATLPSQMPARLRDRTLRSWPTRPPQSSRHDPRDRTEEGARISRCSSADIIKKAQARRGRDGLWKMKQDLLAFQTRIIEVERERSGSIDHLLKTAGQGDANDKVAHPENEVASG